MLFDCGEDSQRQLAKQPQIVHGKINRIFVTDLSSTNIYGIPGKQHIYCYVLLAMQPICGSAAACIACPVFLLCTLEILCS